MKTYYFYLLAIIVFACKNKGEQFPENKVRQSETTEENITIDTSYHYEKRTGTSGNYEYTYKVTGVDSDGNEVTGTVEMEGEYGSGVIIDADEEKQTVEAKWIGYGVLKVTDSEGNEYEVKTME